MKLTHQSLERQCHSANIQIQKAGARVTSKDSKALPASDLGR